MQVKFLGHLCHNHLNWNRNTTSDILRRMKVLTLLLELRCNNYCFFCGSRAIDAPMIETREKLGLSVPSAVKSRRSGADAKVPQKRYTLESAVEALTEAATNGFTCLSLQGGEPSL